MDFSIYAAALPEIILAIGAMALLMLGAFMRNGVLAGKVCGWLALGVLVSWAVRRHAVAVGIAEV